MSYLKSWAFDKLREKYRPEAVLTLSQAAQQMADFAEDVAKEIAQRQKPTLFTKGQIVQVDNPQYRGKGIVQYDSGARKRIVGVLLENGNTWNYDADTVKLVEVTP